MNFDELWASGLCQDGNGNHCMKHHSSQLQMDQKKGKKNQMWWVVVVAMCTTPPWQALMSCEHHDCTEMLMEIIASEH
jgi:hypothetical protein